MTFSNDEISQLRAVIREEIGLVSTAPLRAPWKIKPQRTVQPGDKAALDALLAADPAMRYDLIPADKRDALLRYGTPAQVLADAQAIVAAFGGDWYDVVKSHKADMLGMTLMIENFDIDAIARPPAPAGSIEPTKDPIEILHRAVLGRDWAGSPPVSEAELTRREAIVARLVNHAVGARHEWYLASSDALTVLVCGCGMEPYTVGLTPGAAYPYVGAYDLASVCSEITAGGQA